MTRITVSLITLGDPHTLSGGYLYHRRMAAAADRYGATVRFLSFPRLPFPLPAASGRSISRAARSGDVCVVDSIAACYLAPWLRLVPPILIASCHQGPGGLDHAQPRKSIQKRLDLLAYERCRALIVASPSLAEELIASGVDASKIEIVPPGKDVWQQGLERLDLRRGRRGALLCVANWLPRKGILQLIEALAQLPADEATLHLVGDHGVHPRYSRRVRQRLRSLDLEDRVVVHGVLDRQRLSTLYASADVFILPSEREPYGTAYGEAMASGLPVIAWNAGNAAHLVRHGVEGLLVEGGDISRLADAIHTLIDEPDLRGQMGSAALARSRAFPTWQQSEQSFFDVIRRQLGSG